MTVDYKTTIFLPRTDFAMKANLPTREPEILARWAEMDLYGVLRAQSEGREKFILHDGPPYANGHIHLGTALNKILKDVVNRSQQMLGKDANYVPGWDCHGLPIEWKIEEQYRAAGKNKDDVRINDFRGECREFANKWIDVQREEFKRLGVIGDWDDPYLTMAYAAEADIARELMKFSESGQLYLGSKPVMWSVVEKTALAEAEVEYHDHVSTTIWVKFPVIESTKDLGGASVVIWTTTPWTIPANRAIAYSKNIAYGLYEVTAAPDDNWAAPGDRLIMADALAGSIMAAARVDEYERKESIDPAGLSLCAHPFRGIANGEGYWDYDVPVLVADYVTDDQGTGFVHTAPGHGADDYNSFVENRALFAGVGLTDVPHTVGEAGEYYDTIPIFAGKHIYTEKGKPADADDAVAEALAAAGALLARGRLTHQYPHSWRSKAPLIFRNTPQWFISMGDAAGAGGLRKIALAAIEETRFVPAAGKNRLRGMIESRPDWVISRQRAWGVPIPVFVNKASGEILTDPAVNQRIVEAFEAEGADAWFVDDAAARFLGDAYDPDDWEKVGDILDVWFDSGSTHSFVLEARPDLEWPASLYLEGSDQHRGWFHSSLLESCGTRGRAPFDAVLTHGFVMTEDGRKMSKSLGNDVKPQEIVEKYGADVLRLWVVGSDYSEDLRIGPEIIKHQVDLYRRLRNTLRFLLGNLADFSAGERVEPKTMPELERWVLHRLSELDALIRGACDNFDFHTMSRALHEFCAVDLSAFYFDIRKDALYCDPEESTTRRSCRTVLDILYDCLTAWLAPLICFTAEEVWLARADGADDRAASVHLRQFPDVPLAWRDDELAAKWQKIRTLRRVVTGALEIARAEKRIGSSLQAHPRVCAGADYVAVVDGLDLADIVIASDIDLITGELPEDAFVLDDVPDVAVMVDLAEGEKCARCWKVLPDVGSHADWPDVCGRCADAVAKSLAGSGATAASSA